MGRSSMLVAAVPVLVSGKTKPGDASSPLVTTAVPPAQLPKSPESVVQGPRDLSPPPLPQTVFVLFTLLLVGISIYLIIHFWKKNRHRRIPTLYKLEGYRYSRLTQNELDMDSSVIYYRDALEEAQSELDMLEAPPDNHYKPATLHVETDSLINTSNCTRSTGGKEDSLLSPTFQQVGGRTLVTLEEASDEDLLQ